jgi:hypothetical protein
LVPVRGGLIARLRLDKNCDEKHRDSKEQDYWKGVAHA